VIRWLLLAALIAALWRVTRSLLPAVRPEAAGGTHGAPPPRPSREGGRPGGDAWAVLGVPRGATREEVTAAYRDLMKRYHPDRVADLGDELQQVAHEKTLQIQRAYDELTR